MERAADPRELLGLPQPHLLWARWEARLESAALGGQEVQPARQRTRHTVGSGTETSLEAEEEQEHTGRPLPGTAATSLTEASKGLPGWSQLDEPVSLQQHEFLRSHLPDEWKWKEGDKNKGH